MTGIYKCICHTYVITIVLGDIMEDIKQEMKENDQENNEATDIISDTETKEPAVEYVTRRDLDAILEKLEKENKDKWVYMDSRFDGIIKALKTPTEAPKEQKEVKNTDLYKN